MAYEYGRPVTIRRNLAVAVAEFVTFGPFRRGARVRSLRFWHRSTAVAGTTIAIAIRAHTFAPASAAAFNTGTLLTLIGDSADSQTLFAELNETNMEEFLLFHEVRQEAEFISASMEADDNAATVRTEVMLDYTDEEMVGLPPSPIAPDRVRRPGDPWEDVRRTRIVC